MRQNSRSYGTHPGFPGPLLGTVNSGLEREESSPQLPREGGRAIFLFSRATELSQSNSTWAGRPPPPHRNRAFLTNPQNWANVAPKLFFAQVREFKAAMGKEGGGGRRGRQTAEKTSLFLSALGGKGGGSRQTRKRPKISPLSFVLFFQIFLS